MRGDAGLGAAAEGLEVSGPCPPVPLKRDRTLWRYCEERGAGPRPPPESYLLVPAPCEPSPKTEPAWGRRWGVTCESHVNVYIGIFMFVYIFGVCEVPINQTVCVAFVSPLISLPFRKCPSHLSLLLCPCLLCCTLL